MSADYSVRWVPATECLGFRFAQDSVKATTRDGQTITELATSMYEDGYNPETPMRVVLMDPGPEDSPEKKPVTFDTRRAVAARELARWLLNESGDSQEAVEIPEVAIEWHDSNEKAAREYKALKHLTFDNPNVPARIRQIAIENWHKWHDPERLARANVNVGTFGHLVLLRMAQSVNKENSDQANYHHGFKQSPVKRGLAGRQVSQGYHSTSRGSLRRNLF